MGASAPKTMDSSHSPDGFLAEKDAHFSRGPANRLKGFHTRFFGRDKPWSASPPPQSVFAFPRFTLHLDLSGQVFYIHLPTD